MNKIFFRFLLNIFVFALFSFSTQAEVKGVSAEIDKIEIAKVNAELSKAVNDVKVDKALSLIDDRIVFVNIPGTVTSGHNGIKKYFDIMLLAKDAYLKSANFDFVMDGEPLIIDGKFAMAHGHSLNRYHFSTGNKIDLPVDWTGVMIKENNQWKVISLHVAANIFKNPLLDKLYLLISFFVGLLLIVVAVLFYFLGKKKGQQSLLK